MLFEFKARHVLAALWNTVREASLNGKKQLQLQYISQALFLEAKIGPKSGQYL
jgi:hypothetical protein